MLVVKGAIQLAKEYSLNDYEAYLLLSHLLHFNLAQLRTRPSYSLNEKTLADFVALCQRYRAGEPLAYLLGEWSFWSFTLKVTPDTLVPRPETEHLIDWVLHHFPPESFLAVADLGTGTGAIALALALERPTWQITATDNSPAALAIAKQNAANLKLLHIQWGLGFWFDALPSILYDIIISNPPYIASSDPHLKGKGLAYEPQSALVAADHGMADLNYLIEHAPRFLKANGWLVLEHGCDQAAAVRTAFTAKNYHNILTFQDYANLDRFTCAQKY